MKEPRLNRPTTRFERARPWIVIGVLTVLGLALGTLLIFGMLQALNEPREDMFTLVTGLGVVSVVLLGFVSFYSLRKRTFQEKVPGSMMAWLQSHVYLGFLSLLAVLIHIWIPSFSAEWSTGKLTLVVLVLLIASGVAWRIAYEVMPPRVANKVGNLSVTDTQDKAQMVRVEIDKVLAGKSNEFRQAAQRRLSGLPLAQVESAMIQLPLNEQDDWNRFGRLSDRLERYARREARQKTYARFLQGWKQFHLPLAVLLTSLIAIHVWDTLHFTHVFLGGKLSGLPPASACASCHAGIVDEWRLSMHAQAQTGPVAIAQTNLALERFPNFGKACNNCHAPVGVALTGNSTLPLDKNNNLRPHPNGTVLDDGVTCIICHTLTEAPEERRGMFDNFPVAPGGSNHFADMVGPASGDLPPLPNARHNTATGFITDSVSTSQLCGSCHNVKIDVEGDGEVSAFPGSDGNEADSDSDGQLDENELEFDETGKMLQDLVIQTTYDEWEDYVVAQRVKGQAIFGCVDCHMPAKAAEPLVPSAPGTLLGAAPERPRHSHTFVGVDYNLSPGHYAPDERELVLQERTDFLRSAASLAIRTEKPVNDKLSVTVDIESKLVGHALPTGFIFSRQMWLDVSARTTSGRQVCLADVNINGKIIGAQCASGKLESPQSDLATCDPLALTDLGLKPSKNDERIQLGAFAPLSTCDPWLANFQKILTDGDPDGDGVFSEVPYQSLLADILKTQVRVSDQQAMEALNPTLLVDGQPRNPASFEYIFNVSDLQGEEIIISATLHFRHQPPYFIRALDGSYPNNLTAADLLPNLTVVDMAEVESEEVRVP